MTSRFGVLALGASFALALAAQAGAAETVKVGVILTYSGPAASLGDQIDKGMSLYIKEHEKDLPKDITLELIRRDDTGLNPATAKRLAQELITRDHVNFIAGLIWSPNALAIAPLSAEAKVPTISSNAAAVSLTRLSPYVARVSFTLWQECLPFGQWAATKGGLKKVYIAVSDFAPGHEAADAFTKGFKDAGGQIVDNVAFPVKDPDFVPFLQRVKDAKPDAVFIFVPSGKQATALFKAYDDLGMRAAGIKIIGPQDIVPDEELPNMGQEPLGVITAGTYSNAATRPANKAYVAAWKREYGDKTPPGFMSVGGWDTMAAIFGALKATQGNPDPDKIMAALKGWKNPDSPRGEIMIDPETRDIVQHIYIRRVEKLGDRLANVEFETLPMTKDPWKELNPAK
ncbi:MAG TPA: ABC transporter substrate-binding protein [Stellaceae bacterium]|jgi:branched-chain amino acid transport system substrate-binding protein|nr:ABC transporter substrate-binding protein [Stellaceae bacterium]